MSDYKLLNREVELKDRTPVTQAVEIIMILDGMWLTDFNGDMSHKSVLTRLFNEQNVDAVALSQDLHNTIENYDYKNRYLGFLLVISAYCVQAIREYMDNNEIPTNLAWAYVQQAERELMYLDSARTRVEIERQLPNSEWAREMVKLAISERASKGGKAKAAKDPKQTEKSFVFECWDEWQKNPSQYRNNTKFAEAMIEKFRPDNPDDESRHLNSVKVITDWCREWKKSKSAG